jgi:flavin-dependent thymidylate synthase
MVELKFHCSMPIFVARQWIRHRMANVNESSARYSLMPMLFYTPEYERVQKQGPEHHHGRSGEPLAPEDYRLALGHWQETREQAKHTYTWLTQNDVIRELARIDLPLSSYTQWYWKVDLHNLMHFLRLNVDTHAQWELREYARVLAGLMRRVTPLSYEAWIDYDVCSARFSRMELEALRSLLAVRTDGTLAVRDGASLSSEALLRLGMSHREITEFVEKLQPAQTPSFEADPARSIDATIFEQRMAAAVPEADGGAPLSQLSQLSVPQTEPVG